MFVRKIDAGDFTDSSGRSFLLEHMNLPVGPHTVKALEASATLLGLRPHRVDSRVTYMDQILPFDRGVIDELFTYLKGRCSPDPWWDRFADLGATESETYGLFARHLHQPPSLVPTDKRWCQRVYSNDEVSNLRALLDEVAGDQATKAVMVHSRLDCDWQAIHREVRALWE